MRAGRRPTRLIAWVLAVALLCALAGVAWWLSRPRGGEGTAGVPVPSGAVASEFGVVDWIADGDTLDVVVNGTKTRVRLLNIDAPELAHDGAPAQCLSDEASRALGRLTPVGDRVRVDSYGHDGYGRLLAGVYTGRGVLVNAELVRLGLAGPLVVSGQRDLLAPVLAAQVEAAASGAGLHGAASCSLPGRLEAARARFDRIPASPGRLGAALQLPGARAVADEADAVAQQLHADARNALVQGLTGEEYAKADTAASRLKSDADALIVRLEAIR